jgi:aromatic ring-cleaving dioxygenase
MAIQSNASTAEVVGGIKTFSGLTNVTVKAVNPTMAELHAMDINVKQEPNYSIEFSGESYNKIVFWLANSDGNLVLV